MPISVNTISVLKETSDLTMPVTPQSAFIMRIGGRDIPLGLARGHCVICNHPCQSAIEWSLVRRRSLQTINKMLPEGTDRIDMPHVVSHLRTCMLSRDGYAALRHWVEREAEGYDTPGARATDLLDDLLTSAENFIESGAMEANMKPSDAIAIVKMAMSLDEDVQAIGEETYTEAFATYLDAVREHTTEEQQRAIARALATNPVLRRLAGQESHDVMVVEATAELVESTGRRSSWNTEGYEG